MRKFCTTSVFLFFNLALLAQPPGGVSGQVAWLVPEPVTGDVYGQYHWVDYSGYSRMAYSHPSGASSVEFLQPADSLYFLNFHPAMSLSTDTLVLSLPETSLAQYTVFGVFAPKESEGSSKMSRIDRSQYQTSMLTQTYLSHENDTLLFNSSSSIRRAKIVTYHHSNSPQHTTWERPGSSRIVLGNLHSAPGVPYRGYCAELIVYNRLLNPLERLQVESYLALKYGISHRNSYYDRNGDMLWTADGYMDYLYYGHLIGLVCDSINGFFQTIATTSDAPYDTVKVANSSFHSNIPSGLPTSNRLLVFGMESGQDLLDGEYALIGDNEAGLVPVSTNGGTWNQLPRKWLLRTNSKPRCWMEVSYDMLPSFKPYRSNRSFLVISPSDTTNVSISGSKLVRSTDFDVSRKKIIFHDIPFDTDMSGRDLFTLAWSEGLVADVVPSDVTCEGTVQQDDGMLTVDVQCGTPCYEYDLTRDDGMTFSGRSSSNHFPITGLPSGLYSLILRQTASTSLFSGNSGTSHAVSTSFPLHEIIRTITWNVADTVSNYSITTSGSTFTVSVANNKLMSSSGTELSEIHAGDSISLAIIGSYRKVLVNGLAVQSAYVGFSRHFSGMSIIIGSRSAITDIRTDNGPVSLTSSSEEVLVESSSEHELEYEVYITSECSSGESYVHLLNTENVKPFLQPDTPSEIPHVSNGSLREGKFHVTEKRGTIGTYVAQLAASGTSLLLVYDAAGRLLLRQPFDSAGRAEFRLPYAGVFLVKALADSEEFTEKITTR